jgi:acyl-CoA thioesterase FadM
MQASNPSSVTMQARIQWVDTDASGHYHYTAAFRLFEAAEALLLSRLGLLAETHGNFPRVHASANFKTVLRFYDLVDTRVIVAAVGESSIRFTYEIRRDDELCVDGAVIAVLLGAAEGQKTRWSERQRRLLLDGGEQEPEPLVTEGRAGAPPDPRA